METTRCIVRYYSQTLIAVIAMQLRADFVASKYGYSLLQGTISDLVNIENTANKGFICNM